MGLPFVRKTMSVLCILLGIADQNFVNELLAEPDPNDEEDHACVLVMLM
jgi:hypothetical protein